jgi:hypothetical protein
MQGVLVHSDEKIHFPFVFPTNSTGALFHLIQKVPFFLLQHLWPQVRWHALSVVSNGTATVHFPAVSI